MEKKVETSIVILIMWTVLNPDTGAEEFRHNFIERQNTTCELIVPELEMFKIEMIKRGVFRNYEYVCKEY